MEEKTFAELKIGDIMKLLPHRYPFLLIDRVTEIIPNEKVVAYKNVTFNENFFQGHFPAAPVMPGVLIIEAMAQTGIVLVVNTLGIDTEKDNMVYLFTGIEKAKFRRPVVPGDKLVLECTNLQRKMQLWKMDAKAYVDGQLVAQATLTAAAAKADSVN